MKKIFCSRRAACSENCSGQVSLNYDEVFDLSDFARRFHYQNEHTCVFTDMKVKPVYEYLDLTFTDDLFEL